MNEAHLKTAVVSLVIGEKYGKVYDHYFLRSHQEYARRIGADFLCIRDWIEKSDKHPTWQKLLMFRVPELKDKRIVFLDADIYVTKHAQNPFPLVPEDKWGAVLNNAQNIPSHATTDLDLLFQCPQENRPSYIINSGFLVLSPSHQPLTEHVYYNYKQQSCGEQGPLSYHLITERPGELLPWHFNTVIPDFIITRGRKLSTVVNMYRGGGMIHSAGGMNKPILYLVKWMDHSAFINNLYTFLSKIPVIDAIIGWKLALFHSLWWRFDKHFSK